MPVSDDELRGVLERFAKLTPRPEPEGTRLSDLRRGRRRPPRMTELALIERQGFVTWEFGRAFSSRPIPTAGRRAGRRRAIGEKVLFVDRTEPLGVNQIGQYLMDFDLNLNQDIDRQRDGRCASGTTPPKSCSSQSSYQRKARCWSSFTEPAVRAATSSTSFVRHPTTPARGFLLTRAGTTLRFSRSITRRWRSAP